MQVDLPGAHPSTIPGVPRAPSSGRRARRAPAAGRVPSRSGRALAARTIVHVSAAHRLETSDGNPIAENLEVAATVWSRFVGLMFRRELPAGRGLLIRPCSSIHMFFMRFPLDVLFVDGEGRVVRVLDSIRPWRASMPVRGARAAIELPAGTASRYGVVAGTLVRVVETTDGA